MGRSRCRCLLTAILLVAVARSAFAVRIAVVGDGGEAAGRAVDMAQAQMTGDAGVQFVERQAIKKILDEQKLSLSGAVSAQQAVQAGKILGADLLAVVDKQEDAAGVVVFDARTGVRLCDQALGEADEKTATGLAEALRESVRKMDAPVGKRRPICLLTVRNVDLPKADDAFCQAVARLTERRLLGSPDVVLLERERLNELRKEREIAPADAQANALFAAVTLLELQVAKEESGAIRATCVLTDNQGQRVGTAATAITKTRQANELAEALVGDIAKGLQIGVPTTPDNPTARRAEAARFYREARFWWAHEDYDRPVAALEAAVALDPENASIQAQFAWAQVLAGLTRIEWAYQMSTFVNRKDLNVQTLLRPRVSREAITESLELVLAGSRRLVLNERLASNGESAQTNTLTMKLIVAYLMGLRGAPSQQIMIDAQQMQSLRQIREDYWGLQRALFGTPRLEDAHDWDSAVRATAGLHGMLADPDFYGTATRDETLTEIQQAIAAWRDMCKRAPPTGSPCLRGIAQLLEPERMQRSLGYGSAPPGRTISPQDPEKVLAIYDALGEVNDPSCKTVAEAGKKWAEAILASETGATRAVRQRTPQLLRAGRGGTPIVAATAPEPAKDKFWKDSRLLLDFSGSKPGEARRFSKPIVSENCVYVLAMTPLSGARGTSTAKLVKIDLARLPNDMPNVPRESLLYNRSDGGFPGDSSSIADGYYIWLPPGHAPLELFPLDGSAPITLDAARGFDFPDPDSATILNGKLYAAGTREQGLLIEYDLVKRTSKTLAASRRTDVRSPFDNQPPLRVPFIISDPARDRIVFSAAAPGWPKELAGLWEYNVKTEKFKSLMHADRDVPPAVPFEERRANGPIPVVFGERAFLGGKILDLRTDELVAAPRVKIHMDTQLTAIVTPQLATDHFQWTAWGRARIPDGPEQRFSTVANEDRLLQHYWRILPLDDDRFLAYDLTTLWLLYPPDNESAPIPPENKERPSSLPPPIIPPEGGELPWSSVHTVYDHIRDVEKTEMYAAPRVVGEDIYVLGIGHDLPKELRPHSGRREDMTVGFGQLLRYRRDGGPVQPLGKLTVTGVMNEIRPDGRFTTFSQPPAVVALDDHSYYAAMHGEPSILIFPLDGSPGRKIAVDGQLRHLAMLDGQLYAGWQNPQGPEYPVLARIDPVTGKAETLLYRVGEAAAWRGSYHPPIHNLWSDSPRHRLLYLAQGPAPDPKVDGLWELIPASGAKRLLLPLFIDDRSNEPFTNSLIFWTGSNSDGSILVFSRRGLFAFDPATDKAAVIMQHHPDCDPLASAPPDPSAPHASLSSNSLLTGSISSIEWPCAIQDGYLWYVFGRVSLDGTQYEAFPDLRSGPTRGGRTFVPDAFQFLDGGKQLLVSDCYGAWILDLRK